MTTTLALFNDFESTGIDTQKAVLLEGYFDLRLYDVEREIWGEQIYAQHVYIDSEYDRSSLIPIVEEMHQKNGLWEDLKRNESGAMTVAAFDSLFSPVIAEAKKEAGDNVQIHLAGMGVANYDKRMIERDMPLLNSLLHYRCLDVSIIHTMARMSGWTPAPDDEAIFGGVQHRAKGDVEQGIAQFNYFLKKFNNLSALTNA